MVLDGLVDYSPKKSFNEQKPRDIFHKIYKKIYIILKKNTNKKFQVVKVFNSTLSALI